MPDHYAVQKGQSLLDVAADLTHSTDKAVKQTLANALFAANPNAFYGNNPSRMKLGAVLAVPRPGDNPASIAAATGSAAGQGAASAVRDVAPAPAPAPASASLAASGAQKAATTATTTPTPTTVAAPTATTAPTPTTAPMPTKAPAAPTVPALTTIAPQAATPGIASVPTAASSAVLIRVASESESVAPASTPTQASASATAGSNASDVSPASAQATSAAQPASVSSPAAAASTAASTAQAWAGSIRPAPAAPPASSAEPAEAASLVVTSAQNVSSLQQLLQLKNRVLAAMQAHSFSTGASNAGTASVLNAASGAASVPRAAVSASTTHTQGPLRGPLALPAALAVLIVVALGIWVCLPSRRRKPHRDADDLPPAGARSSDKAESPDSAAETDAQTPANAVAPGVSTPGVSTPGASSQGTAPASRTANAAKSRLNAGLERETPSALPPDDDPIFSADVRESPFGQPPFSFEEGAAGGLPTHDPQRSPFAESSRTPFDTGLLLGLLEMHAHRREVERFQETAHELWELTDGEGPDWKRAAQLGRRIDPENPLYADDPFTALRQHHETSEPGLVKPMPDVDLSLPEDPAGTGAQTTQAAAHADPASDTRHEPDARASEDAASGVPATGRRTPGADLDWLDVPSGAAHEAFQPHTPAGAHAASDETLPEARGPGHVPVADPRLADGLGAPVARAPSVADEIAQGTAGPGSVAGLGASFDLADALNAGTRTDTGRLSDDPMRGAGLPSGDASQDAPEHREDGESARPLFSGDAVRASALRDTQRAPSQPGAGQPSGSPAGFGAAGFGALKLDFDLELTPNAAAPGSTPTSHDLATIARNKLDLAIEYVELGDRSGARTLLNEVLATHDAATQERAQTLLDSLK